MTSTQASSLNASDSFSNPMILLDTVVSPTGHEQSCYFNALECPPARMGAIENIAEHSALSNVENENPGALAGATGADVENNGSFTWGYNPDRHEAARSLAQAAADCPPEVRAKLLERLLDVWHAGWPQVPFMATIMEEAQFWADMASRRELKAYCLASFQRMDPTDRDAFLAYVQGEQA